MNGSKPCGPSGGPQAPSPKRRRPRLRVSCSPSPQPSPPGEGETFARALVIRPSLVVVCLRNERQRSGDCNRNVRIFQRRASALPLLGERVGVRGNEANSNPRRTTIPGTVKLRESPAEPGVSQFGHKGQSRNLTPKSLEPICPSHGLARVASRSRYRNNFSVCACQRPSKPDPVSASAPDALADCDVGLCPPGPGRVERVGRARPMGWATHSTEQSDLNFSPHRCGSVRRWVPLPRIESSASPIVIAQERKPAPAGAQSHCGRHGLVVSGLWSSQGERYPPGWCWRFSTTPGLGHRCLDGGPCPTSGCAAANV